MDASLLKRLLGIEKSPYIVQNSDEYWSRLQQRIDKSTLLLTLPVPTLFGAFFGFTNIFERMYLKPDYSSRPFIHTKWDLKPCFRGALLGSKQYTLSYLTFLATAYFVPSALPAFDSYQALLASVAGGMAGITSVKHSELGLFPFCVTFF
jgi:hypothetical protein